MTSRSNFSSTGRWPDRVVTGPGAKAPEANDPWLGTKEAARYLGGISPRTLERWRVEGGNNTPPYAKLGPGVRSRVLYRQSDLDAWLARFSGYRSTSEYGGREEKDEQA